MDSATSAWPPRPGDVVVADREGGLDGLALANAEPESRVRGRGLEPRDLVDGDRDGVGD